MFTQLLAVGGAEETDSPDRPVVVTPRAAFGTLIVRGVLGTPGAYAPGDIDPETGDQLWEEVEAPTVWPGYYVELHADSVIEALEPYVVATTDLSADSAG